MTVCGATTRNGGPCGQAAGWGTPHPGTGRCKLHGGAAPNAIRAAEVEQAREAVVTLGGHDPADEQVREVVRFGLVEGQGDPG